MASPMDVRDTGTGQQVPQTFQVTAAQVDEVQYKFAALQGEGERLVQILDGIVKSAGIKVPYNDLLLDNDKTSQFLQFVSESIQTGQVIQGDPEAVTKFQTWNDNMGKLATAMGIPPRGDQEDVQAFNKRLQESLSALLQRGQEQIRTLEAQIETQRQTIHEREALHQETLTLAQGVGEKRVEEMRKEATSFFTSEFERVQTEGQVFTRKQYEDELNKVRNDFSTSLSQDMAENERKLRESMAESILQQKLLAYDQEQVRNQLKTARDELKQARTNKNANAATIGKLNDKLQILKRSEAVSQATTELQLKGVENRYTIQGLQNKIANLTKSPVAGNTELAKVLRILEESQEPKKDPPNAKSKGGQNLLSAKKTVKKKKLPELTGNQMTVVAVVGAGLMALGSVASGMMAIFR